MFRKILSCQRYSVLIGSVFILVLVMSTLAFAPQFFDKVGVGMQTSPRGEHLRVLGQAVFGRAGGNPGVITLMPKDNTGFFHIHNPGKHRLMISGGEIQGKIEYMTISHPGDVTIRRDLHIDGNLFLKGKAIQEQLKGTGKEIEKLNLKIDEKAADVGDIWKSIGQINENLRKTEKKLNELIEAYSVP